MEDATTLRMKIEDKFKTLHMLQREANWYTTQQAQIEVLEEIKLYWTDLNQLEGVTVAQMHVEALRFKYM